MILRALALAAGLAAQAPAAATPPPAPAPVIPGTETPQAIVKALYDVISGAKGAPRDWVRFKALGIPDAHLVATHTLPTGVTRVRVLTMDQYVEGATKGFANEGFFETGAVSDVHVYDRIATVVSPYESRHAPGEAPFARGVNHVQLVNDGRRWFVVDIFWEDETPQAPLPPALANQLKH
ncbi:hypothetical protein BH09PSE2_BH09PSE2_24740 [soil metagenome]